MTTQNMSADEARAWARITRHEVIERRRNEAARALRAAFAAADALLDTHEIARILADVRLATAARREADDRIALAWSNARASGGG